MPQFQNYLFAPALQALFSVTLVGLTAKLQAVPAPPCTDAPLNYGIFRTIRDYWQGQHGTENNAQPCFDPHCNAPGKPCCMAMAGTGFVPPAPTPRSFLYLAQHAAARHGIGQYSTASLREAAGKERFNVLRYRLLRFAFSVLHWHRTGFGAFGGTAPHRRDAEPETEPSTAEPSWATPPYFDGHVWFYMLRTLSPACIRMCRATCKTLHREVCNAQQRRCVHSIAGRRALVWIRHMGMDIFAQLAPPLSFLILYRVRSAPSSF